MSDPLEVPHSIALAMNAKEAPVTDPKPTIRVESCRDAGRCPECGDPGWVVSSPTRGVVTVLALPCGCATCINWSCTAKHTRALLAEALRQLSDQRERGDQAESARVTEQRDCLEVVQRVEEERDAAIRQVEEERAAERAMLDEILALPDIEAPTGDGSENVASVVASALEALREERDAAIRRLKALDLCTVCAGTGKPVSGKPCICGGHGGIGDQITGLTREAQRAHEKAAQFEADWMAAKYEFGVTLTAGRERAEKAEALLRKCESALTEVYLTYAPAAGERVIGLSPLICEIREVLK